jgi:hypothetical protein
VRAANGRALRLQELLQSFAGHRLLLLSDGACCFNPVTGLLERWAWQLQQWNTRILLTPRRMGRAGASVRRRPWFSRRTRHSGRYRRTGYPNIGGKAKCYEVATAPCRDPDRNVRVSRKPTSAVA